MSRNEESFETLEQSLESIFARRDLYNLRRSRHTLILEMAADVAAFSVFNGQVQEEFDAAYREFKAMYKAHHTDWDKRTLSFVLCRATGRAEDDRFYATQEHDPLFCRKYVIQAHEDVRKQRDELLRLPFLPFPEGQASTLARPQAAQDLLQSAGLSASFTRKLVEARRRAPEGIVEDLLTGRETVPKELVRGGFAAIETAKPRTITRLSEVTVQKFRAYRKPQSFSLDASIIVLYGPNGLGKTSFFDAVDYACTGRIGRLCRQRQLNQEDFSRVSTYLDDTPGTGSVDLRGKTGVDASWSLRRGTGNWSTSWINGDSSERLDTLIFLTNSEWGDSRPRLQNVESLFRATHLFGQDEQELLTEFRKSSVIPEEFVSEMLALQDYARSISKISEVSRLLIAKKTTLQAQLGEMAGQKTELASALATEIDASGSHTKEAIDSMIADIRARGDALRMAVAIPEGPATVEGLGDWVALASAQIKVLEERLVQSRSLRNELTVFSRLTEQIKGAKQGIADLDAECQRLTSEQDAASREIVDLEKTAASLQASLRELERRRRELALVSQWFSIRADQSQKVNAATAENTAIAKELAVCEGECVRVDAELEFARATQERNSQKLSAIQTKQAELSQVSLQLSAHRAEVIQGSEIGRRQVEVGRQRQEANETLIRSREKLIAAESARKQLAPEYERVKLSQAELETLLDAIQSHLSGCECPLCGTTFSSNEALAMQVRRVRDQNSSESEVASRFASLKTAEDEARIAVEQAAATLDSLMATEAQLKSRSDSVAELTAAYLQKVKAILGRDDFDSVDESVLVASRVEVAAELDRVQKESIDVSTKISDLMLDRQRLTEKCDSLRERTKSNERLRVAIEDEVLREESRAREVLAAEGIDDTSVAETLAHLQGEVTTALDRLEQLRRIREQLESRTKDIASRLEAAIKGRGTAAVELQGLESTHGVLKSKLSDVELPSDPVLADKAIDERDTVATRFRQIVNDAGIPLTAVATLRARMEDDRTRKQIELLEKQCNDIKAQAENVEAFVASCRSLEKLLETERQSAVEKHIAAYGPLITNIQQRLRSVYGFGGVHLEAQGGEAAVQVEWRNRNVHCRPTDFFSDSQKQILMLSVFLAGCLRQNWSGFAPVLLDDPVTHFDDLNAYGFVELIRGIVASKPNEWQFIISTCEERLFSLMRKKFSRFDGGAIFYEFLGMSDDGPIVERR